MERDVVGDVGKLIWNFILFFVMVFVIALVQLAVVAKLAPVPEVASGLVVVVAVYLIWPEVNKALGLR